jgi:hypothetical protein
MFVCKTLKDMATLLDLIRESPDIKVVRFKDRIENPSGSWRDAMINFRLRKEPSPFSNHICEVQIVHEKMALCRRKDGLGGHDEYVQQRNACETLEYLGEAQPEDKPASVREKQEAPVKKEAAGFRKFGLFKWVLKLSSHRTKNQYKVEPAIDANS